MRRKKSLRIALYISFPKKKQMSKEDSIKIKDDSIKAELIFQREIQIERQTYKLNVESNVKFLEENFNKPFRSDYRIEELGRALDLRGLPVLSKVVLYNPRSYNRVIAIEEIAWISRYNKVTSAFSVLREALKDNSEEVQLEAACKLIRLGQEDSSMVPILFKIAKGEGEENWLIDYAQIGLDHMSDEKAEAAKLDFRKGLRRGAIMALGYLSVKKGNKECSKLIEELRQMPEIRKKFMRTLEQIRQDYNVEVW